MPENSNSAEALRQLHVCNACRYCEGYCEVFGAVGRLPLLGETDVAHLANICHDCRACYQACMYTEPHEFAVNIPQALSTVRLDVYTDYAPPKVLGRLLRRGTAGVMTVGFLFLIVLLVFMGTRSSFADLGRAERGPGAFYERIPSWLMLSGGLAVGFGAVVLIGLGQIQYWRANYPGSRPWRAPRAFLGALRSAAALAAMRGGGDGCYYPEADTPSHLRWWMHMLTAYGFVATFAATCAAALYQHVLGQLPPYGFWSAPVVLGTVGGAMMIVGVSGLLYLKSSADRELSDARGRPMEYAFLITLLLLAVTGLLLLILRSTALMPSLLAVHLALVGAFFLTLPYGKMVHLTFRFSALFKERLDVLAQERERDVAARKTVDFAPTDPPTDTDTAYMSTETTA